MIATRLKVIQTVIEVFKVRNVLQLLVKAAYTCVAASLIEGTVP
jgi:hypothetical protein